MAFMIIDRNFWQRLSNISLIEAVVTGKGHAMYVSFFKPSSLEEFRIQL